MDISVAILVDILDFGNVVKVLSMAIYEVKDTHSYHFKNSLVLQFCWASFLVKWFHYTLVIILR